MWFVTLKINGGNLSKWAALVDLMSKKVGERRPRVNILSEEIIRKKYFFV